MAPGVSSCIHGEVPPAISFSGSGFMATYQLGVAQCFLNYAPWILRTAPCVLGASAGSLVAAAIVCEMSIATIRDEMLYFAKQMKTFALGPFNPSINVFHWLECILHKYLPPDAHHLANGRLSVAMTRLSDGKLIMMSEFQSKEDVLQALLCSCFVPGYCGILPPSFKGEYYVDGGFTSMQPVLHVPHGQTLTVSPFSGEMDICPADTPCMLDMVVSGSTLKCNMANSLRIINALYPVTLETLEQAYHSGYKDAIHFLLSNDLAPYLMKNNASQELLNCNQTKTWMYQECTMEEEKEMKVEKDAAALTSFTTNRSMQTDNSTEHELTEIKESPVHFNILKNVLLDNVLTHLSMFGLPARVVSHLLLPLTLVFYALLQSTERFPLFLTQVSEVLFWAWHGLRHFTFFFFNVCIGTLKKNIQDHLTPTILLLQWIMTVQNEAPQSHAAPPLRVSNSAH